MEDENQVHEMEYKGKQELASQPETVQAASSVEDTEVRLFNHTGIVGDFKVGINISESGEVVATIINQGDGADSATLRFASLSAMKSFSLLFDLFAAQIVEKEKEING